MRVRSTSRQERDSCAGERDREVVRDGERQRETQEGRGVSEREKRGKGEGGGGWGQRELERVYVCTLVQTCTTTNMRIWCHTVPTFVTICREMRKFYGAKKKIKEKKRKRKRNEKENRVSPFQRTHWP